MNNKITHNVQSNISFFYSTELLLLKEEEEDEEEEENLNKFELMRFLFDSSLDVILLVKFSIDFVFRLFRQHVFSWRMDVDVKFF